jgi:hypothetical protein
LGAGLGNCPYLSSICNTRDIKVTSKEFLG